MEQRKSVEIPESLYNRIETRLKGTGFASVSEYVSFVLRERMNAEESSKAVYSKEDEEKIKARLKDLGYL